MNERTEERESEMVCTLEVNGGKVTAPVTAMAELLKKLGLTTPEAVVRNTLLPEVVTSAVPPHKPPTVPPSNNSGEGFPLPDHTPKPLPVKELYVNMKGFRKEIYHSHKLTVEVDGVRVPIKPNWVSFAEYVYVDALSSKKVSREDALKLNISNGKRRAKDFLVNIWGDAPPPKFKTVCNGEFVMRSFSSEEACLITNQLFKKMGKKAVLTFSWYGGKNEGREGKIVLGA